MDQLGLRRGGINGRGGQLIWYNDVRTETQEIETIVDERGAS